MMLHLSKYHEKIFIAFIECKSNQLKYFDIYRIDFQFFMINEWWQYSSCLRKLIRFVIEKIYLIIHQIDTIMLILNEQRTT